MNTASAGRVNRFLCEVTARFRPLEQAGFRVLCGQTFPDLNRDGPPQPCSQHLGSAFRCADAPALHAAASAIAGYTGRPLPSQESWVLRPERGHFAPDARGRYHIAHPRRPEIYRRRWSWREPVGRRPMPAALRAAGLAPQPVGAFRVIGHLPVLPATVVCPYCGQSNRVDVPPAPGSPCDGQAGV